MRPGCSSSLDTNVAPDKTAVTATGVNFVYYNFDFISRTHILAKSIWVNALISHVEVSGNAGVMDVTEYVNGRQLAAWRRDMNNNGGEMERTALSTSVKGLSPHLHHNTQCNALHTAYNNNNNN